MCKNCGFKMEEIVKVKSENNSRIRVGWCLKCGTVYTVTSWPLQAKSYSQWYTPEVQFVQFNEMD